MFRQTGRAHLVASYRFFHQALAAATAQQVIDLGQLSQSLALEGCAGRHLQRCNEPGVPLGDEYIFDYNVVAARAAHSQGIPGIEDFRLARGR
jgi:hypothetical protein